MANCLQNNWPQHSPLRDDVDGHVWSLVALPYWAHCTHYPSMAYEINAKLSVLCHTQVKGWYSRNFLIVIPIVVVIFIGTRALGLTSLAVWSGVEGTRLVSHINRKSDMRLSTLLSVSSIFRTLRFKTTSSLISLMTSYSPWFQFLSPNEPQPEVLLRQSTNGAILHLVGNLLGYRFAHHKVAWTTADLKKGMQWVAD